MKQLSIILFILLTITLSISAQPNSPNAGNWYLNTTTGTFPNIYCGTSSYPGFVNEYFSGARPTAYQIAYNYYNNNASTAPNPAIEWRIQTYGPAQVSFTGSGRTYVDYPNDPPTTPALSIVGFNGGTQQISISATLHLDYGNYITDPTVALGSFGFNLICEATSGLSPTTDQYCSFQLTPTGYSVPSAAGGPPYNGSALEFNYGSIAKVYDCPAATTDGHFGYYYTPGPQASTYTYSIDPGWSYAYTSTPNTLVIIPPAPVASPHAAYSSIATITATGSGSPIGGTTSCVASYASLPLKVDYPVDPYFHGTVDPSVPTFTNQTILSVSANTGYYDLKQGDVGLKATLVCDQPNVVNIDWYEVDEAGKTTLLAENTDNIKVKVAGYYIAYANLEQGSTVNATTGDEEDYTYDKYYIAQSNTTTIYNSDSDEATVDSMTVYPNPVCGRMTVNYLLSGKVTSASLILTNVASGTVVLRNDLFIQQQTQSFDISTLPNGTYIATIDVNGSDLGCANYTFLIMCQ